MTDFALEADNLTGTFGTLTAVLGVTLSVPKGQLYGFLGLNGAGETTTIRMLTTLLPPSAGTVRIWGHDVVKNPLAVRGLIGPVSDETSESQSDWTAREYPLYFARLRDLDHAVELVGQRLISVGLEKPFRDKRISTYGTGMKRRVEIARALLGDPKVVFSMSPHAASTCRRSVTPGLCRETLPPATRSRRFSAAMIPRRSARSAPKSG